MRYVFGFLSAVILIVPIVANADSLPAMQVNCDEADVNSYQSRFVELRAAGVEASKALCDVFLLREEPFNKAVQTILTDYATEAEAILHRDFDAETFPEISQQFEQYKQALYHSREDITSFDKLTLGVLGTSPVIGSQQPRLYFSHLGVNKGSTLSQADDRCAAIRPLDEHGSETPFTSCKSALEDASQAFNAYQYNYNRAWYQNNKRKIGYLRSQWDKYIDTARAQTFLDIWFTTLLNRSHYQQDRLVAPAPRQYFLLRPQVVYEFAKDAESGDRNQVGLAVEWAGVNYWNWKIPFGVSLMSVYADYEQEDSVGVGLMFTFNNNLSVGWVDRGDTDGIYVTMDFLKFWSDKSRLIKRYRKDPLAWLK